MTKVTIDQTHKRHFTPFPGRVAMVCLLCVFRRILTALWWELSYLPIGLSFCGSCVICRHSHSHSCLALQGLVCSIGTEFLISSNIHIAFLWCDCVEMLQSQWLQWSRHHVTLITSQQLSCCAKTLFHNHVKWNEQQFHRGGCPQMSLVKQGHVWVTSGYPRVDNYISTPNGMLFAHFALDMHIDFTIESVKTTSL